MSDQGAPTESPNPLAPPPEEKKHRGLDPRMVSQWIALGIQVMGASAFVYEIVFVHPINIEALSLTVAVALGGRLSDLLRTGGL